MQVWVNYPASLRPTRWPAPANPIYVAVVTFWFKKNRNNNKYERTGNGEMPDQITSVDFSANKDEKFRLLPGDASVYVMAGSANAHFTHTVTCKTSTNGDWLRVSVPTFLFW